MRPNLSDEIVEDVDTIIEETSSLDPEMLGFEQKLRIVLGNIGDMELETKGGNPTEVGSVVQKYS